MKRIAESHMTRWIRSKRRKPLILRGARQVGKSTLVRLFAAQHKRVLNEINLERHKDLETVFRTLDTDAIRNELEAVLGRSIASPDAILFLDEIQATPSALPALRYLYEDYPDLPIVAAGSLLEFALADHDYSMPVGRVQYHHLGPMTFGEFLTAVEPALCRYLDDLDFDGGMPHAAHSKLLRRHRQYLFTGGLPEAVLTFQDTVSLEEVSAVHRSIADTYEDDFAKYARQRDLVLLQRVFRLIPRFVGQKIKYVNFSRTDRARDVKTAIDLLEKARVCLRVFASHCSGIPLSADVNEFAYKLLFLDVGLLGHISGLNWGDLNAMDDLHLVNEGILAEQFVGQHLAYADEGRVRPQPVYWLREGRNTNAEVDFAVSSGTRIYPVEVKAGRSGTLRSLHQFVAAGKSRKAVRFDTNPPSRQPVTHLVPVAGKTTKVSFELLSMPLYAVGELERLLAQEVDSN